MREISLVAAAETPRIAQLRVKLRSSSAIQNASTLMARLTTLSQRTELCSTTVNRVVGGHAGLRAALERQWLEEDKGEPLSSVAERCGYAPFRKSAMISGLHLLHIEMTEGLKMPLEVLTLQAVAISEGASFLATRRREKPMRVDEAWLAGLFANVGIVVMAGIFGLPYTTMYSKLANQELALAEAEESVFGFHHGEAGFVFLQDAGFSEPILETTLTHIVAECCDDLLREYVALAEYAAQAAGIAGGIKGSPAPLDPDLLKKWGLDQNGLFSLEKYVCTAATKVLLPKSKGIAA